MSQPIQHSTPQPLVVADIGGTNARFAWVDRPGEVPQHVSTLPTADHPGPGQAMRHYLQGLPSECRDAAAAHGLQAGWALAAVVTEDPVVMTNNAWRFSRAEEARNLGLSGLHLYNDFEALACALPYLGPQQLRSWDGRLPRQDAPLAVIGPGTGLGVAGMAPTAAGWHALCGEGGHMTLSAADDFEAEVIRLARGEWPHVSAERLLSGIGLPLLHRCVQQASGLDVVTLETERIVALGLEGQVGARRTLEVFCSMLGSFAGNVALTLGARGGVYVGGGLVPRLGDVFFASNFRRSFESKGRFASYLADVPTVLIIDTMVALRGVSAGVAARIRPPSAA